MTTTEMTQADMEQAIRKQAATIRQLQDRLISMQSMMLQYTETSSVDTGNPYAEMSPVEIMRVDGAETTVIACAGLITRFGMPPKEFFRSFIDRGCNVMFLKDFRQCWYQKGLLSLSRNIGETVEVLQGLLPAGTKSVRFTGTSAGGFAALQFGIRMNADRILAFGPQTRIGRPTFDRFASFDSRPHDIDYNSPDVDVRNAFTDRPDFSGRIDIHFASQSRPDVNHANTLAGFPGVHLHEHDHDQHMIAAHLRETGALDAILGDFVS